MNIFQSKILKCTRQLALLPLTVACFVVLIAFVFVLACIALVLVGAAWLVALVLVSGKNGVEAQMEGY